MVKGAVEEQVVELLEVGVMPTHIAKELGISRNTVYRVKEELKKVTVIMEATVIKLVPNERVFLAEVAGRLVRVVKKVHIKPIPRSTVRVQKVNNDLYRLVSESVVKDG